MKYLGVEELVKQLEKENPDKMLLEDGGSFLRGKLAGKIELIERIKAILENDDEEEEDGRED